MVGDIDDMEKRYKEALEKDGVALLAHFGGTAATGKLTDWQKNTLNSMVATLKEHNKAHDTAIIRQARMDAFEDARKEVYARRWTHPTKERDIGAAIVLDELSKLYTDEMTQLYNPKEGNAGQEKTLGACGEQSAVDKPQVLTPSPSAPKPDSPAEATEEEEITLIHIKQTKAADEGLPFLRAFVKKEVEAAEEKAFQDGIDVGISHERITQKENERQAVENVMGVMREEIGNLTIKVHTARDNAYNRGLDEAIHYIDARWPNAKRVKA